MTQQQVGASEQRLSKQLERLKGIEKSEIRMIEADRQRFRIKYRKTLFPRASTASTLKDAKINDPTILRLDDHRQTSATDSGNQSVDKYEEKDYEAVRSLIFTEGKVDLDKILCLHLLSIHVIDIDEAELQLISQTNGQSAVDVEESEKSSNDILPCYVVKIQRDESLRFHKRSEELSQPEGQLRYRHYDVEDVFQSAKIPPLCNNLLESSRGNAQISTSLEHLQKYIHTGQMLDKSDGKTADKLKRAQSSSHRDSFCKQTLCTNEKYFVRSESSSVASKSLKNQSRNILICINTQLKNFVETVIDILRNINFEKTKILFDMLKSSQTVTAKLSEMNAFVSLLENFSFVSLPENFVCIPGYALEDTQCNDTKFNIQPVAETIILESDVPVFNNLLEIIRQSIGDFVKKSNSSTASVKTLSNNASMISVPQSNTADQTSSKISLNAMRKSDEKIESNEFTSKNYNSIQREFNEATNARLAKNIKKSSLYTDPDRVILRRMTNSERIRVGQMCAALKTKKINNEGLVKEKIPLPALLKPVLSRESFDYLTQDTIYAKSNNADESKVESKTQICSLCIKLTGFILTKIYHEVMEVESRSQLQDFMNDTI